MNINVDGKDYDIDLNCPKCGELNKLQIDLKH